MQRFLRIASVVVALGVAASAARADERDRNERNPCESLTPAAAGGPVPHDDERLVVRWLGTTNYELSFRNQVILLDTYYDRGPRNRPIGLMPDQVTRADAIFLGHGHFDHMSDASFIASKLGTRAIGGPPIARIPSLEAMKDASLMWSKWPWPRKIASARVTWSGIRPMGRLRGPRS